MPITACKQYCLAAGATQGNIACAQTVIGDFKNNTTTKKQTKNRNEFLRKNQRPSN